MKRLFYDSELRNFAQFKQQIHPSCDFKTTVQTNNRNKCTQRLATSVGTYSLLFPGEQGGLWMPPYLPRFFPEFGKTSAILETSDCVARVQTTSQTTSQWAHWKLTRDLSPSKRFSRQNTVFVVITIMCHVETELIVSKNWGKKAKATVNVMVAPDPCFKVVVFSSTINTLKKGPGPGRSRPAVTHARNPSYIENHVMSVHRCSRESLLRSELIPKFHRGKWNVTISKALNGNFLNLYCLPRIWK